MRLKIWLNEEQIPKTKKFGFIKDNPGGGWLSSERERAEKSNRKISGSVTALFDPFLLKMSQVFTVTGLQDEKRSLSSSRVQELMNSIKEEGIKNPIFINVNYKGKAYINEGNRRLLIAKELGLKYVPVEIRYFAGGERIETRWHPDNIIKYGKEWRK